MQSQAGTLTNATKAEKTVWEEQWIACAKQLNQWDMLLAYARDVNQFDLLLESTWKTDDWSGLRDVLQDHMPCDGAQTKIYDIFNALQEWRLPEAEKHCQEAFQYALKNWCLLPEVTVQAYVPLMQTFHRLVELHESCMILEEVNKSVRHNTVPEFKNTIQAWRERLPNKWDDVTVWHDLLTWRTHIFKMLTESNQSMQDIKQALVVCGQHEEAWTVVKMAEAARKQGLPQLCLSNLQSYQSYQQDVQHAYSRTREEVLARLDVATVPELQLGLSAVSKLNLDYFNALQKGEILRLKGEFYSKLPDPRNAGQFRVDEAHAALTTAVATADTHAKAWVSWGKVWDALLQAKMDKSGPVDDKQKNFAENTVSCYLQGVRHGSDRAHMLLSKVLWILDTHEDFPSVGAEFDKNLETVPSWNWIFWVPLLLGSLARPQALRFRKLLTKLAAEYPQSLYCPLRRFLIEKQGQSRAAEGGEGDSGAQQQQAAAAQQPGTVPAPAVPAAAGQPAMAAPGVPQAAPPIPGTPTPLPAQAQPIAPAIAGAAATVPAAAGVDAAKPDAAATQQQQQPSAASTSDAQAALDARSAMVVRQHAQEIMKHLRDTHLPFFLETERFVVEITRSFKPSYEQQLQNVLAAHVDAISARDLGANVAAEDAERVESSLQDLFSG